MPSLGIGSDIAHGIDDIEFPHVAPATVAGISAAIVGNVLISLALNLQKLAHLRLARERAAAFEHESELTDSDGEDAGAGVRVPALESEPNPWDTSVSRTPESEPLISFPASSAASTPLRPPPPVPRAYGATVSSLDLPVTQLPTRTPKTSRGRRALAKVLRWEIEGVKGHANGETPPAPPGKGAEGDETEYLKSKLWWSGFLLMNVGELGNFISYAFAPASIVAPLGTFALVANCVFAPVLLGEHFRKRDLFGIVVAIFGAVTVVFSSNTTSARLSPSELARAISQKPFIGYCIIYLVGAIVLASLSEGPKGRKWVLVDVGICALFGGFTVLATKGVSTLLTLEWIKMFKEWIFYPTVLVLFVTGVGQIKYLNRALMRFDSKIVIPTQFVLFNLSAILGSAILYGDFQRAKFHQFVTFVYGCLATFAGVWIIASGPASGVADDESAARGEDGEDGRTSEEDGEEAELGTLRGSVRNRMSVPVIRPRQSTISLVGLSPAQRLLLVHTPPTADRPLPGRRDGEAGSARGTPESRGRRRAISWDSDGRRSVER